MADDDFRGIHLDAFKEFHEAAGIDSYATANAAHVEITHRRTYSRPNPAERAISPRALRRHHHAVRRAIIPGRPD
jgi:hypothetical protein